MVNKDISILGLETDLYIFLKTYPTSLKPVVQQKRTAGSGSEIKGDRLTLIPRFCCWYLQTTENRV